MAVDVDPAGHDDVAPRVDRPRRPARPGRPAARRPGRRRSRRRRPRLGRFAGSTTRPPCDAAGRTSRSASRPGLRPASRIARGSVRGRSAIAAAVTGRSGRSTPSTGRPSPPRRSRRSPWRARPSAPGPVPPVAPGPITTGDRRRWSVRVGREARRRRRRRRPGRRRPRRRRKIASSVVTSSSGVGHPEPVIDALQVTRLPGQRRLRPRRVARPRPCPRITNRVSAFRSRTSASAASQTAPDRRPDSPVGWKNSAPYRAAFRRAAQVFEVRPCGPLDRAFARGPAAASVGERLELGCRSATGRNRSARSAVAVRSASTTTTVRPARPRGRTGRAARPSSAPSAGGGSSTGSTPQKTTTSARFLTSPSVAETRPILERGDPAEVELAAVEDDRAPSRSASPSAARTVSVDVRSGPDDRRPRAREDRGGPARAPRPVSTGRPVDGRRREPSRRRALARNQSPPDSQACRPRRPAPVDRHGQVVAEAAAGQAGHVRDASGGRHRSPGSGSVRQLIALVSSGSVEGSPSSNESRSVREASDVLDTAARRYHRMNDRAGPSRFSPSDATDDRGTDVDGMDWKRSPRELQGLRAAVLGSTSGIGRAVALALAEAGADVIVHGRSLARGGRGGRRRGPPAGRPVRTS